LLTALEISVHHGREGMTEQGSSHYGSQKGEGGLRNRDRGRERGKKYEHACVNWLFPLSPFILCVPACRDGAAHIQVVLILS
jgi:hypothetical protein